MPPIEFAEGDSPRSQRKRFQELNEELRLGIPGKEIDALEDPPRRSREEKHRGTILVRRLGHPLRTLSTALQCLRYQHPFLLSIEESLRPDKRLLTYPVGLRIRPGSPRAPGIYFRAARLDKIRLPPYEVWNYVPPELIPAADALWPLILCDSLLPRMQEHGCSLLLPGIQQRDVSSVESKELLPEDRGWSNTIQLECRQDSLALRPVSALAEPKNPFVLLRFVR